LLGFVLWSLFTAALIGYVVSRFYGKNQSKSQRKSRNRKNEEIYEPSDSTSNSTSKLETNTLSTLLQDTNLPQIEKDELSAVNSVLEPELQTVDTKSFVLGLDSSFELDQEEEEAKKEEIKEEETLNKEEIPLSPSTPSLPQKFKHVPNIAYLDSGHRKHHLDLYIPTRQNDEQLLDVVVHVHGGGWKRGDRSIAFYGAPSMCKFYASGGFLAVAPSYRLGKYPHHMEDVSKALIWVHQNIKKYGGNGQRISLSGHSAGGNIAALFAVNASVLVPELPSNFIRGVVCVSGVYSLHQPLGGGGACTKNFIFLQRYVRPVFGTDETILINNSPLSLIQIKLGVPLTNTNKKKKWTIFKKEESSSSTSNSSPSPLESKTGKTGDLSHLLPPFLLLSASWDMGLETDAQNFYQLLKQLNVNVKYHVIPNTNHATICWTPKTEELALNFVRDNLK